MIRGKWISMSFISEVGTMRLLVGWVGLGPVISILSISTVCIGRE